MKRGGGSRTRKHLRVLPDHMAAIDDWISKQKDPELTRPEVIRRLIERGLKVRHK